MKISPFLLCISLFASFLFAEEPAAPSIIPRPTEMKVSEGSFEITRDTLLMVSRDAKTVGQYFQKQFVTPMGFIVKLKPDDDPQPKKGVIVLTTVGADASLGKEGYNLDSTPEYIVIKAPTTTGLFYGIQSIRQMLPPEIESPKPATVKWVIPAVSIKDVPRYAWRGVLLDVGRHFFPPEFIKKYIDTLALHKMNSLQLHLTDDQGWRIEIKKYPQLTKVGSKREATPLPHNRQKLDDKPYSGFFTQADLKSIVQYAAERHINILPEIEMPGHAGAALASYPNLGCTGGPYKVKTFWGVHKDVFCAGKEETFTFLEDVLTEVLEIFPSKFIHIGGDECPKGAWKKCASCQSRIKDEKLKNEYELQSYVIKRMEKFLSEKGRRLIGWDEILEGGLAPGAAVMSWRGTKGGVKAASEGHDVVMSPTSHCYLDYYQSKNKKMEPPAIGGFLPLKRVYSFDPMPKNLAADKQKHILGGQGNVWTEYIQTPDHVTYMTFPRASAIAEALWTPAKNKNYDDFLKRFEALSKHLDILDVKYKNPFKEEKVTFSKK